MPTAVSLLPDISLTTAVRLHLGLSVRQLARYLGVTAGFVTHIETGRRGLPPGLVPRLLYLAQLLPPPLGPAEAAPPELPTYDPLAPLPEPDSLFLPLGPTSMTTPEPLRRRLRDVRLQLLTQGQRLAQQQARAAALAQRRWGLAQLQAALAPAEPTEAARYARWLGELATDLARDEPDPAGVAVARQLLAARVAGLRAEVAALMEITLKTD